MNWKKLSEERPIEDKKLYVVAYANPYYTNEPLNLDIKYYHNSRFDDEITGANYIAFWLDDLEMPFLSVEERNKLVRK